MCACVCVCVCVCVRARARALYTCVCMHVGVYMCSIYLSVVKYHVIFKFLFLCYSKNSKIVALKFLLQYRSLFTVQK